MHKVSTPHTSSRVVRTAYDPLGRRAFTALQHDDGSLFALADSICGLSSSTSFVPSLSGEGALYGYRRPPHGPAISRDDLLSADYYDDYNFLRHFPQHADSLAFRSVNGRDPRGDVRLTFSTTGHLTGSARRVIPHSGSGPLLPSAFYYDERGRLVQSVAANHLGGYDRTALSLSFDGRVLASTHIHSSPDTLIIAERIFDWNEDLAPSAVRMRVNGGPWIILTASVYDDFRRTVSVDMIDGGLNVDYDWADSGELQSISSEPFSQTLYRRSVPPGAPASLKPLFNGRVCAESFSLAESPGANGRKLAASYSYSYDGPRLLSADYAEASRSERPLSGIAAGSVSCQNPDYSVRYSWNPDGAPLSIRRHGLADRSVSSSPFPSLGGSSTLCTYGLVDDISLSWKGPRLDRADDNAEDCTLSIATDFSEKVRRDGEYAYDPDGRLSRDSNKGVTISYNILGLPSLVCDGVNRIRRTYDSQGTLLRTEYGTERIEFTSPEPGQVGAIVATPVFDLARVADRCGPVEYADHAVERYIHEAGWIDADGRHVAAVRDCRRSLRATWTAHSALPPAPGTGNNTNGSNSGNSNSALVLPGTGIGQVLPAGNVYADLTAYYPFGLPFADWQGASRDLFSGKELERSGNLLDYDFHARRLDPQLLIFDRPDPLAATYPHLNPYLYCAANPVSLTDPSGRLVSAPESRHLSTFRDDAVFAAGFNKDLQKDYKRLFKIDYKLNQLKPFNEEDFENFIAKAKPTEDQEIILRYTFNAINAENFTIIIDYTPNDEYLPDIAQDFLNTQFSQGDTPVGTYKPIDYKASIRKNWGGALSFEVQDGGFSTIDPSEPQITRSRHTVHEVLGHVMGYNLGYGTLNHINENNAHALQIESVYNRIHNLPKTNPYKHSLDKDVDINGINYLKYR